MTDPTDTLKVKRWLGSDGSLQPAVENAYGKSSTKRLVKRAREGETHSTQCRTTNTLLDYSNDEDGSDEPDTEPLMPQGESPVGLSRGECSSKVRDGKQDVEGMHFSSGMVYISCLTVDAEQTHKTHKRQPKGTHGGKNTKSKSDIPSCRNICLTNILRLKLRSRRQWPHRESKHQSWPTKQSGFYTLWIPSAEGHGTGQKKRFDLHLLI